MPIAVAVSGGRDSTALLHVTLRLAQPHGLHVCALHVHHGLHADADAWAEHLRRQVARWSARDQGLSFHMHRVPTSPAPGDSVEAWARRVRYETLTMLARQAGCDTVLLAHHRRDQAETVLLQALRGGGPAGLAAMPAEVTRDGIRWLRPWLNQPRERIEHYVRRHRLRYVDDGSNADPRFARNRLRAEVLPALVSAFPDAEASLARVAWRAQEARACLDELAQWDLQTCTSAAGLQRQPWLRLSPARRANVLRAWLRAAGVRPDDALLLRLLDELPGRSAARWPAGGAWLTLHRGCLRLDSEADSRSSAPPARVASPLTMDLSRPGRFDLRDWHGALVVEPASAVGLAPELLRQAECRQRTGGEDFQLASNRPARALKKQYQSLGVPAWQRGGPLVYTPKGLAFVPGLGLDARVAKVSSGPRLALRWEPDVSRT